ncbi:hypothetical protein I7V35_00110 [Pseudochrobactrum saccharolyticum]|nr:hypothetical protein [Pseudochrobactrum saccharolyticum]
MITIVPSSTHYIRTAGESMRGDGKGGLYIDEPNGTANTVDSLDGRTWYKVVDVQSERVLHTPKISRMIPRSLKIIADGLPLSPLDFGARGMDALRDADGIQSALQFLADFVGDSDATLDCGGKRFLLNRAIAPTSASGFYRKRITNGFFRVASSFPADTYMFDLSGLGNTGNQISRIRIDNNFFVGAAPGGAVPRAYGWIKLNYTLGNDIHDNVMEFLTGRGIWDENTRAGAGNYIRDNRMFGSDTPGNYITGIRVAGYDNKIYNNMLAEFSEHIRCEKGANVISGNHVYNFRRGNTEGPGISTGREENSNETLIQGNYIDTVRIDVYNPENTTITGNKFLIPNISYWAERPETAFIELVSTQTTGTHYVDGLQIIGNQFKSSYGVAEAIRARTAGAALIIRDDVFIKDNIFMRVNKRAAQASITKEGLAAVTSTTIDLSSFKIPSVSNDHLNMVACAAQGTGGSVTNLTRSNDVYTVNFSSPFTGKVTLSATMCANGAW